MGWCPCMERSTMASRRDPRANPASSSRKSPASSGPRWRKVSVMARSLARDCSDEAEPRSQKPVIPHMVPRCDSSGSAPHACRIGAELEHRRARRTGSGPTSRPPGGGTVEERTGVSVARRGCRVVTTSMTARLLLGDQLRALDEVSWSVVSGDAFEDAPEDLVVEVVPIRRQFALSDFVALVRLWRYFPHQRFDFAQTHTPKASFLGLPAARLSGTTAIYTIHGALFFRDNGRLDQLLGWLFERWCCAWADLVLVQSREDEQVLPRAHVCGAGKIRYVGNGVVLDRFTAPVAPARSSARPVVLMVSRLVREKGCVDFLGLARSLRGRADFVHVGPVERDQRDALSSAEIAAASDTVTFVG